MTLAEFRTLKYCAISDIAVLDEIERIIESRDELLAACQAFIALFCDSDMRPEDECHELYEVMRKAVARTTT